MSEPLIGLMGLAGAGKDTFANQLRSYGYVRLAFADKVRELALELFPGVRVTVNSLGWSEAKKIPYVRELLQNLGVSVRNVVGEWSWVNATMADWDETAPTVVTDVRFLNEARYIHAKGGWLVRIDRPDTKQMAHVSEHEWQGVVPDLTIDNDQGYERLGHCAGWLDRLVRLEENEHLRGRHPWADEHGG